MSSRNPSKLFDVKLLTCGLVLNFHPRHFRDDTPEQGPSTDKDKLSESESENSQRSSTDRDFEMVEPADLEDPDSKEGSDTKEEPDPKGSNT